mmetsp:Transcript_125711/g.337367  ORF Transcript_125711/g.337367 Transcript_125711/m.337367 type:complete len:88 (+) Transcript_125711:1198-1461(+)
MIFDLKIRSHKFYFLLDKLLTGRQSFLVFDLILKMRSHQTQEMKGKISGAHRSFINPRAHRITFLFFCLFFLIIKREDQKEKKKRKK